MKTLARLSLAHPRLILCIALAITGFSVVGLTRSWTDVGYRIFLGDDHPAITRLDTVIERFGGGLPIIVAWQCGRDEPCLRALDETSLRMAAALEHSISAHPLVVEVHSPASADVVVSTEDALEIRQLLEHGRSPHDLQTLRQLVLNDPLWVGSIVSPDETVGAMVVQLSSTESRVTAEVVPFIRSLLVPYEDAGFSYHLAGDPVDFVVSGGQMQADTPKIMAGLVLGLVLTSWLLLRSWSATLLALGAAGVSLCWAMGAMGWLGWPEMELTQALRPGILVVALCDAIHVITRYGSQSSGGSQCGRPERGRHVISACSQVATPCLLTSLTTFAAFLSFTTSGSGAFVRFGIIAALGVFAALVVTFSVLPLALTLIDPARLASASGGGGWKRVLDAIARAATRHRRFVVGASVFAIVVGAIGMSRLEVDLDERELLGRNSLVVRWATFIEDHLRKSDTIELILRSPEGVSVLDPASIALASDLASDPAELVELGNGRSLVDVLSNVNRALSGGDEAAYRPASSTNGNAQLLLLLELAGSSMPQSWSYGDRELRISYEVEPIGTKRRKQLIEALRRNLESALPAGWTYDITGPFTVYLAFADVVQQTQLWSFASALAAITGLLWLAFRARVSGTLRVIGWTAAALVPSVAPVVVTLGAMGFFGIPLDVGTAMVGAIVIGIAVDDSIHLTSAYLDERRQGRAAEESVRLAIVSTGQALVTSSVALSVGFFALVLSSWQSIASFGLLSGLAILMALLCDLFFLPALVLVAARNVRSGPTEERPSTELPAATTKWTTSCLVLVVSAGAMWTAWSDPDPRSTVLGGCSVSQDGRVMPLATLRSRCTLKAGDVAQVASLAALDGIRTNREVEGRPLMRDVKAQFLVHHSEGQRIVLQEQGYEFVAPTETERWSACALLVFSLILSLSTVWLSSARAATASGLQIASVAAASFVGVVGTASQESVLVFAVVLMVASSSSLRVLVSFPSRTTLITDALGLSWTFRISGLAIGLAVFWGHRTHAFVFQFALLVAGSLLLITAARILVEAMRSVSGLDQLDDRRARSSALGLLAVVGAGGVWAGLTGGFGSNAIAAMAAAAPVPVGWSLLRYQHYTTSHSLRAAATVALRSFALALAVALSASIVILLGLPERPSAGGWIAFSIVLAAGLSILFDEAGRTIASRVVASGRRRLEALEEAGVITLDRAASSHEICQNLVRSISDGIGATGAVVATFSGSDVLEAASWGDAPDLSTDSVRVCRAVIGGSEVVHCGPEGGVGSRERRALQQHGVAIVAPVRWDGSMKGLMFVSARESGLPYSDEDLAYTRRLTRYAAASLRSAEMRSEMIALERAATLQWVGAGLMHSVGKPLSIAARSAERLVAARRGDPEVRRLAEIVRFAADEALNGIKTIRGQGDESTVGTRAPIALEEVISRAVGRVKQLHDGRIVVARLGADLPLVKHAHELRRVLVSLMDNALLATGTDDRPPEVSVLQRSNLLWIDVTDFGSGMSRATLRRATDPFFTTRSYEGGSGIGLFDARFTVERLGGELRVTSQMGEGTTASLLLPLTICCDSREEGLPSSDERRAS